MSVVMEGRFEVRSSQSLGSASFVDASVHCSGAMDAVSDSITELEAATVRTGEPKGSKVFMIDDDARAFFEVMYGNEPARWDPGLTGHDRLRAAVNYFTRMRFLFPDGTLELETKESAEAAPEGCVPWFEHVHPDLAGRRIVFGHWAALEGRGVPAHCRALDTGCVWGGCLTLLRLEDDARWQTPCARAQDG